MLLVDRLIDDAIFLPLASQRGRRRDAGGTCRPERPLRCIARATAKLTAEKIDLLRMDAFITESTLPAAKGPAAGFCHACGAGTGPSHKQAVAHLY